MINHPYIAPIIFDPEPMNVLEVMRLGLKFTQGRKYPLLKVTRSCGVLARDLYMTIDDGGAEVNVDEKYFTRESWGLIGDYDIVTGGYEYDG